MDNIIDTISTFSSSPLEVELFCEIWAEPKSAVTVRIDETSGSLGTHPGLKRLRNEDRVCMAHITTIGLQDIFLAILCDGVGGTEMGDVAASLTISNIISEISKNTNKGGNLELILTNAIRFADKKVSDTLLGKGATTLSIFIANVSSFSAVNIGDSRIFSWDIPDKNIVQISEDDTIENELKRVNKVDLSALNAHGLRGRLSQAIGETGRDSSDLNIHHIQHSSFHGSAGLILASDGAWKDTGSVFEEILKNSRNSVDAVRRSLATATWAGGSDNISILSIENIGLVKDYLQKQINIIKNNHPKIKLWLPSKEIKFHTRHYFDTLNTENKPLPTPQNDDSNLPSGKKTRNPRTVKKGRTKKESLKKTEVKPEDKEIQIDISIDDDFE
ncbi:serine/threonine-protein phosphatase [Rahnella sp. PD12R]|uniref:PP2C family protein-serine/threonine phosphatase n=1 Tax=Rahnella sp. PD12R TaxID=2855688 RepID=UPI001C442A69|nr:PP2C family serine/threonine-protein phosphatase [Rahnella sp. PD12R]MBV6819947.1 serine/threonine-protein phosphatase [Rahnella sp. PD12R]